MKKSTLNKVFLTCCLLGVSSLGHSVDFSTSRTAANTYSDGVSRLLPIDAGGATTRWVYFGDTKKRAVFFNAECALKSSDNTTWFNTDIEIAAPGGAFVKLSPSNNDNAFCSSKGNNTLANWSSNLTQGTYTPTSAGWHRVRIRGQIMGYSATESVRIDDSSLIITD